MYQDCLECHERLPMIQRDRGLHEFCVKLREARNKPDERPLTEFDLALIRYGTPA